jgi:hypothetical protein
MTIAYPVYSRFVMPPAPLGFHHTTTQRAAARGTWSRYVTRRKAATVGAVPRKTSPGRRSGVPGRRWTYSSRPEPSASARRQRGQAAHHDGPAQTAARTFSATTRND